MSVTTDDKQNEFYTAQNLYAYHRLLLELPPKELENQFLSITNSNKDKTEKITTK
jgi:hypothetical protein